jgi:hypothetical protein
MYVWHIDEGGFVMARNVNLDKIIEINRIDEKKKPKNPK